MAKLPGGPGLRILTLGVYLMGVSACAGISGDSASHTPDGLDKAVFAEAYSLISNRYIEPVSVDSLALDGLGAWSDMDPEIAIAREGGKVILMASTVTIREFAAPPRDDSGGWGALTTEVVLAGQQASVQLASLDPEIVYETVFDGALANLDRYSRYASAAEARNHRADREGFGGIGMHLSVNDAEETVIVAVMPETPAERAGLQDQDVIVSVGDQLLQGMDLRQVIGLLRGPIGSTARFVIRRDDEPAPIQVSVTRELIIPTSVIARREGDAGYVRITRFNQGTAETFRDSVLTLREEIGDDFAGLIIDLRDNPGGLLDQAVVVTDALLPSGRIVSTRGRHRGSFQQYDARNEDILDGLPVVVMVNAGSASASEIMAAALQDDGRAVVVGSNSYGKGVVQSVYRLPNDGEMTLTWSRFHAPSGYNLQDLGIMPTVCTSDPEISAAALLGALRRDGGAGTETTLAAWRQHELPDAETRERLRSVCPSRGRSGDGQDVELEVARLLLGDRALYETAIRHSVVPELANHGS